MPWTIALFGIATIIAAVIGVSLGMLAGWRPGTWLDSLVPGTTLSQVQVARRPHILEPANAPRRTVRQHTPLSVTVFTDGSFDPASGRAVAEGRVLGLAPDGGLRLATDVGERTVHAGEVTLAAP